MRKIIYQHNLRTFLAKFLSESLLRVCASIFQSAVVDESGMGRTQMGTHKRLENGRCAWDALYDTL
jgi:hypothetical protein